MFQEETLDKLMKKVIKQGDCLVWTGCINSDGYPKLARKRVDGTWDFNVKGHRHVYESVNGKIPDGLVVRHTCDNILCVNPEHLLIGTPTDNMRDRQQRQRTHNHVDSETNELIKTLRQSGLSQKRVAEIVGCSQAHVSKLERGAYSLND